jgi:CRP-like cAMP-binding protein
LAFDTMPENIKLRHLTSGTTLVDQGEHANELFLLVRGMLVAEVAGRPMAEIEPGEILHDHHRFDGKAHLVTLRAKTDCIVAVAPTDQFTPEDLFRFATSNQHEGFVSHVEGRSL